MRLSKLQKKIIEELLKTPGLTRQNLFKRVRPDIARDRINVAQGSFTHSLHTLERNDVINKRKAKICHLFQHVGPYQVHLPCHHTSPCIEISVSNRFERFPLYVNRGEFGNTFFSLIYQVIEEWREWSHEYMENPRTHILEPNEEAIKAIKYLEKVNDLMVAICKQTNNPEEDVKITKAMYLRIHKLCSLVYHVFPDEKVPEDVNSFEKFYGKFTGLKEFGRAYKS